MLHVKCHAEDLEKHMRLSWRSFGKHINIHITEILLKVALNIIILTLQIKHLISFTVYTYFGSTWIRET